MYYPFFQQGEFSSRCKTLSFILNEREEKMMEKLSMCAGAATSDRVSVISHCLGGDGCRHLWTLIVMLLQTIQLVVIQVEALSLSILKLNVLFCKDKETTEKRGLVTLHLKPMRIMRFILVRKVSYIIVSFTCLNSTS